MTTQVLADIKEAEHEVERILAKAEKVREDTVAKARQDALRHIKAAEERGKQDYATTVEEARKAAAREAERLAAAAEQDVNALKDRFESRVTDARARIVTLFEGALDAQD